MVFQPRAPASTLASFFLRLRTIVALCHRENLRSEVEILTRHPHLGSNILFFSLYFFSGTLIAWVVQ